MEEKEKIVEAACNISMLVTVIGILICILARSEADIAIAVAIMETGCVMCMVSGHIHERMYPVECAFDIEKWDLADIKKGKYGYMYDPTYLFVDYLLDNSCTFQELTKLLEKADDKELFLDMVYLDYKLTAGSSKVQSLNTINRIIEQRRKEA